MENNQIEGIESVPQLTNKAQASACAWNGRTRSLCSEARNVAMASVKNHRELGMNGTTGLETIL